MRNVSDNKGCRESQNKISCSVTVFFLENNDISEMMWENMVETDRPQTSVQYGSCTFHAGHTDTHLEHEIRIGFSL
jgi:hypothetical protein